MSKWTRAPGSSSGHQYGLGPGPGGLPGPRDAETAEELPAPMAEALDSRTASVNPRVDRHDADIDEGNVRRNPSSAAATPARTPGPTGRRPRGACAYGGTGTWSGCAPIGWSSAASRPARLQPSLHNSELHACLLQPVADRLTAKLTNPPARPAPVRSSSWTAGSAADGEPAPRGPATGPRVPGRGWQDTARGSRVRRRPARRRARSAPA